MKRKHKFHTKRLYNQFPGRKAFNLTSNDPLFNAGRSAVQQGAFQLASLVVTLAMALAGGLATGADTFHRPIKPLMKAPLIKFPCLDQAVCCGCPCCRPEPTKDLHC